MGHMVLEECVVLSLPQRWSLMESCGPGTTSSRLAFEYSAADTQDGPSGATRRRLQCDCSMPSNKQQADKP